MLKVLLCSTLTIFALSSLAQTSIFSGRIAGKIIDEKQTPIDYVTVSLLRANDSTIVRGTLTRTDGTFDFEKVANGSYLISVIWLVTIKLHLF